MLLLVFIFLFATLGNKVVTQAIASLVCVSLHLVNEVVCVRCVGFPRNWHFNQRVFPP